MKSLNIKTTLLTILLLGSIFASSNVSGVTIPVDPTWAINDQWTYVYSVDTLSFNNSNTWPITVYDEEANADREIGSLAAGDLFFARAAHLPDLNNSDDIETRVSLRSSNTTESWDLQYNYTQMGWPSKSNGPIFLMPMVTVPINSNAWYQIESDWNAVTGITATYDNVSRTFELQGGTNTTLNVASFTVRWDTTTGLMLYYYAMGDEGIDSDPYILELSYQYARDESQWSLGWGVQVQDTIAFRWENFTGLTELEYGDGYDSQNNVFEDDLMIFQLKNLANLTMNPPSWNATVKTGNWEDEFYFEFRDIGVNDGPATYYPILPVGNDDFVGNITSEFEAIGATVTHSGDILTVTLSYGDHYEHTSWDLTTGIMQNMRYEGELGEGATGGLDLTFVYLFRSGGEPVFSSEDFQERYVMDEIMNGTDDFLDFGEQHLSYENGTEYSKPFRIFDGDIMETGIHPETHSDGDHEETYWYWNGKTSSGYQARNKIAFGDPGLEGTEDGPPALYFVIPTGSETLSGESWWGMLHQVYTGLGYTVTDTPSDFGFTMTSSDFVLSVSWDKNTGVMNTYDIQGQDDNGNDVVWRMHRSEFNVKDPNSLYWGVNTSIQLHYRFSDIPTPLEFGEDGFINNDDVMDVEFRELGDLQEGPMMWVDMTVGSVTQDNELMGIRSPGFEFVTFEEGEEGGGPPLLYFALILGDTAFFANISGMYEDAGYLTVNNATHFGVEITKDQMHVESYWFKDTGILAYYHLNGEFDGSSMEFTAVFEGLSIITTTTSSTSVPTSPSSTTSLTTGNSSPTASNPAVPLSFSFLFSLPVMSVIIRRRMKN